ncbi:non-ltr retroelement reverse transcriptase [Hordeum vulgare]|nr:non-ltr retroelement reverse transcriptase [Hordeum vulgare]
MKITLWRFAHNCLPSGQQLVERHIPASSSCVFCNRFETVEHTLLFCPYASEVWSTVKEFQPIHLHRRSFTSTRAWTLDFLDKCSDVEGTVLIVVFWHIWDARNKFREGEGMLHPNALATKIRAYIDMIMVHLYKPSTSHSRESTASSLRWIPPPEGTLMINVDATLFETTKRMGVGIVVRDHTGSFIAACSESYANVMIPEMAEALAVRRAVSFALEEGYSKVNFGSDCLAVVQRINSSPVD